MGYVRNNYGCHCYYRDDSFKRYNRALQGDTIIFNYNSNNTYGCCTGKRTGFWGGFGLGFGMSFGNLFGNLFGGFSNIFSDYNMGNMFGGYGMGNMFGGFGIPSWGGGLTTWGLGGTPAASNSNASKTTTKTVTVEKEVSKTNADYKTLLEISEKVEALLNNKNPGGLNKTDIDALKDEINAKLLGSFDGIDDEADKKALSLELQKLDAIRIDTPDKKDLTGIVDKSDLNDEDLNKLISGFDSLTPEQKSKLQSGLDKSLANLKRGNGEYKIPRDYSTLLKLELLCKIDPRINVYVEHYGKADDQWIKGPISHVSKDSEDNISYWVDCENTGVAIKAKWRFTTKEKSDVAKITGTIASDTRYTANIGMSYEYDETHGCYVNKNNKLTAQR